MGRGLTCQSCGYVTPTGTGMPGPLDNVHYSNTHDAYLCYLCYIKLPMRAGLSYRYKAQTKLHKEDYSRRHD